MVHGRSTRREVPPVILDGSALEDIPDDILSGLQNLYDAAYPGSRMYSDLLNDIEQRPEVSRLFLARLDDQARTLVGAGVVDTTGYDFINYMGFPPLTGKRFAVLPRLRSMGIGKLLMEEGKRFSFGEWGFKAIFGASNEVGALSLYGREGALFSLDRINNYTRNGMLEHGIASFIEHITDPQFRGHQYSIYEGIHVAYCADDETAQFFRDHGYASQDELAAMAA